MKKLLDNEMPSRRRFLQLGAAGTAAGLLVSGWELAAPVEVRAQSNLSPDAALNELMDGNQRYTSGKLKAFDEDLAILKQKTAYEILRSDWSSDVCSSDLRCSCCP